MAARLLSQRANASFTSLRSLSAKGLSPRLPVTTTLRWNSTSQTPLKRTGLYDFHVENKAKMVPFAGYDMPIGYDGVGYGDSHKHVRSSVGLFDVGHMVQHIFRGPTVTEFLEYLTPSSLSGLPNNNSTLSVFMLPSGGILDDTMITRHSSNAFYIVTNAGRREEDLAYFGKHLTEWNARHGSDNGVQHEILEGWGLVALQGPKAAEYLQGFIDDSKEPKLTSDLKELTFGRVGWAKINGKKVHIARGGYTGEDGFEISMRPEDTVELTKHLYKFPVQLAGLAARDSLRLEAGLCLYGHDLDESVSPVESGLNWVIGKDRRAPGDPRANFLGNERVLRELKEGVTRKRIGMIVQGSPAREGAIIFSGEKQIGKVTSGIPSPSLGKNIAMGYIDTAFSKKGTSVEVEVRGKRRPAQIVKMPFVETKYYRG